MYLLICILHPQQTSDGTSSKRQVLFKSVGDLEEGLSQLIIIDHCDLGEAQSDSESCCSGARALAICAEPLRHILGHLRQAHHRGTAGHKLNAMSADCPSKSFLKHPANHNLERERELLAASQSQFQSQSNDNSDELDSNEVKQRRIAEFMGGGGNVNLHRARGAPSRRDSKQVSISNQNLNLNLDFDFKFEFDDFSEEVPARQECEQEGGAQEGAWVREGGVGRGQ